MDVLTHVHHTHAHREKILIEHFKKAYVRSMILKQIFQLQNSLGKGELLAKDKYSGLKDYREEETSGVQTNLV